MKFFISQYWKIIVGLVSIFIGGLGFGAVLESLRYRHGEDPKRPTAVVDQDWVDSTLASLDRSLSLTESQKSAVRPHLEAAAREIQLSRESALLKFELSLLKLHQSLAPELEAEQQQKLLQSQAILEERIRQRSDSLLEAPDPR